MKIIKRILLAMVIARSAAATADSIRLLNPIYGGTGCPQGTASAVLSPDNKTLTVLFDQYQAEAGAVVMKTFDRKSCNLAIPVHLPQGLSVSIMQVDYRGTNILPAGGSSRLNVDYFFAGSRGPSLSKNFVGPLNEDYDFGNTLAAAALIWSPCGKDLTLRANTSIMVQSNQAQEDALITVDSADVKASLVFLLQWRQCQ